MNLKDRIRSEVEILSKKYDVKYYEEQKLILIKDYKLPRGWNKESTDVLLTIPAGYPTSKPYAFRVNNGLRLEGNRMPSNYNEGHPALGKNWGQFSISVEEWKPAEDIISGHNLLTFITGVQKRLEEFN